MLRNCDSDEFLKRVDGKKVVGWGTGYNTEVWDLRFPTNMYKLGDVFSYFVDSNKSKHGSTIYLNGKELSVCPIENLLSDSDVDVVVITCSYIKEIIKVLENSAIANRIDIYVARFICEKNGRKHYYSNSYIPKHITAFPQIPKKIHYCWFGREEMSTLNKQCMESWYKFCPDYEIMLWNEENYDVKNNNVKKSYENKMYSKVSNYARLDIIYEHGGIYLDTDVEIVRSIDDLLYNDAFGGYPEYKPLFNTGQGFGARPKHKLIKYIRDNRRFVFGGDLNKYACPYEDTSVLIGKGFEPNWKFQIFEDMTFYPQEYLSSVSLLTKKKPDLKNSYLLHYNGASWWRGDRHTNSLDETMLYQVAEENEKTL